MKNEKTYIITGGSGLLGREMIHHISNKGHQIINFDKQNFSSNKQDFLECDITDCASFERALKSVIDKYGRLDGLVNNAYPRTKDWGIEFESEPFDSTLKNVEMQMVAVMHLCRIAGEHMKNGGSIINIASIYGIVGNDPALYENTGISTAAAYSAIKGGLINFTRYLAARWGERGIRINCISPGGIFDNQDPEFVRRYEARVPMKRMGTPEDIAPVVSFLLSDDARYITGQNLVVDGGWTSI
jgi:NAD(P)-dependent dehydrogenase (short-subunit alcohol dehydrogenase family)